MPTFMRLITGVLLTLVASTQAHAADIGQMAGSPGGLLYAAEGQVNNSAPGVMPATSIQYGFLSYVRGVDPVFAAGPRNESSALFTFYTSATTKGVQTSANLRTIFREGTTTLYFTPSPKGDFSNPDSFRIGTPVQTSTMSQVVVVNTTTGAFTTRNVNVITTTTPFTLGSTTYLLGAASQTFTTFLLGQLHSPPPPSGYFRGYMVAGTQAEVSTCGTVTGYTPATSTASGFLTLSVPWSSTDAMYVVASATALAGPPPTVGARSCLQANQNDAGQIVGGAFSVPLSARLVQPGAGRYHAGHTSLE